MDTVFEKNIFIRGLGVLKIYLSDNIVNIFNTYIKETGNSVCFTSEIKWYSNNKLYKSIKDNMIESKTIYSMIFYMEGNKRNILINRYEANKWYSLFYTVKPSESEKTQYFKKKYPFSFYRGCIAGFLGFYLYRYFGIKILPDKYYNM